MVGRAFWRILAKCPALSIRPAASLAPNDRTQEISPFARKGDIGGRRRSTGSYDVDSLLCFDNPGCSAGGQ